MVTKGGRPPTIDRPLTRDVTGSCTEMKLSPEERSAINRKNASASTGPKSKRGRRAFSMNACNRDMCAKKVMLPHEDPEAIEERLEQWTESCRPADAMELYL